MWMQWQVHIIRPLYFSIHMLRMKLCYPHTGMVRNKLNTVPWGIGEVAMGLAAVATVAIMAAMLLHVLPDFGSLVALYFAVLVYVAVLGVVWCLGPSRHNCSWQSVGLRPADPLSTVLLALGAVVLFLAISGLYVFMVGLIGPPWLELPPPPQILVGHEGIIGTVVVLLVAAVLAPFSEEVFFRGFVLPGLSMRLGFPIAVVLSALLFALVHGAVGLLIPTFIAGLLFAWLFQRTRSLWASIAAHTIQNTLAVSVLT
jgi:membrane protease YdiL (CAAX protease family)